MKDFSIDLEITDLVVSYSVVNEEISVSKFFIFISIVSSLFSIFVFSVLYLASAFAIASSSLTSEIYLSVE